MIALLVAASVAAGIIRTTVGVGAGIFLTASLSLTLDPVFTLAVMAVLQIAFDASAGYHFWGAWERRLIRIMVPCAVIGVVVGAYMVAVLPSASVRRAMGAMLCTYVVLQLTANRRRRGLRVGTGVSAAAGTAFLSGAASSLANVSGVILALYLLALDLPRDRYMASLTAIQFLQDLFKIGTYWGFGILGLDAVVAALPLVPLILVGGALGTLLNRWISPLLFKALVLSFVGISCVRLLR